MESRLIEITFEISNLFQTNSSFIYFYWWRNCSFRSLQPLLQNQYRSFTFWIIVLPRNSQNIYFQFFAGLKLYFRLLQDRSFISGYNNVGSGGQARLFFLIFLGTQARFFIFKFLATRIFILKNCHCVCVCVCVCVCRDILTTL
jgi:hypothetical protein